MTLLLLLLGGCAHLATPAEKEISYRRFSSLAVNGLGLADFLERRTAVIVAGAQPQLIASHPHDVDIRLEPVAKDGFDIGSATAVASDGYFLTAAHCVTRRPIYLMLPSGSGARIVAARQVWTAPTGDACDLALLKADLDFTESFSLTDAGANHADADVVTAGANGLAGGRLLNLKHSPGHDDVPAYDAIVHDAPLAEGDSGGPLIMLDVKLGGIEVLARGLMLGSTQGIALLPDSMWLKETIERDRAAHPTTLPSTRMTPQRVE